MLHSSDMLRRVAYSMLLGSALASLSACGSVFDSEQREPWRAQVEAACLASGQVQETAGVRLSRAIEGPGACGVDHPFKVTSLQTPTVAAFASMQGGMSQPPLDVEGAAYPADLGDQGGDGSAAADGFTPLPDLPQAPPQVRMQSSGPFAVSLDKSVLLSCSMVPTTTQWLARVVQPAALATFGSPVVEMTSFGTYSCRRRNNARRGRLSEHAFANALDVKGFKLADGRETKVLTGWRGSPEEQAFWRDVAFGACQMFNTVLGPGSSDGQHENHLHLDLARHSSARAIHVCRPRVPKGWVALAERRGAVQAPLSFTGDIEEPLKGEDDQ
jgi:hypothetical protein